MSWLSRLVNIFRSERLDQELDDELQFHIGALTEDLVKGGMPPAEAARQARLTFGNRLRLRESSREAKLVPWLDSVVADVRFAARMLRKDVLVAAAAVLSMSLTIGASTAAFSLLNALMLRPLPVEDPEQLIYLTYDGPGAGGDLRSADNINFNYPLFRRFGEAAREQADLFGVTYGGPLQMAEFEDSATGEAIRTQWISGEGFGVLGIRAEVGRVLTGADDQQAEVNAAVLSHAFWMRRFGGDPGVVGRSLTLTIRGIITGRFRIVGVAQRDFQGVEPGAPTDLWFPLWTRFGVQAPLRPDQDWFQVRGRMQHGVSSEQIQRLLQPLLTDFRREWGKALVPPNTPAPQMDAFLNARLQVRSAADTPSLLRAQFERPLWIVTAIAALVLLIACSNIANLFIARTAARERELALRVSIGAGRGRLIQQVLVESGLLVVAGCLCGLAFARVTAPAIVASLAPPEFPAYLDLRIDGRVLAFLVLVGGLTTVLFGLVPALRASAIPPTSVLKTGGERQSPRMGILRPLLAVQVSFSFAVLYAGGLLLTSFHKLTTVDPGFSKEGVLLCTLGSKEVRLQEPPTEVLETLARVRQVPAIQAASLSMFGLLGGGPAPRAGVLGIGLPGGNQEALRPRYMGVSPGFFETMQIPIVAGRDFVAGDVELPDPATAIVNEAFARTLFPGESPLGKRFERRSRRGLIPQEIVGVVRDAKYMDLREPLEPTVFVPFLRLNQATLAVRIAGDPMEAVPRLRQAIEHNGSVLVTSVMLQSERMNNTLLRERLLARLAGFFGVVALVLAAVGLYGVLNYSVVQRKKEIGIRMALGALRQSVIRLVIGNVLFMVGIGIAVGFLGGLGLARLLAAALFGVEPLGFWSLALPTACLTLTSALAVLPVAARASRVHPSSALRHD